MEEVVKLGDETLAMLPMHRAIEAKWTYPAEEEKTLEENKKELKNALATKELTEVDLRLELQTTKIGGGGGGEANAWANSNKKKALEEKRRADEAIAKR